MDFFDLTLDQDELLQRAKHEAEDLAQFKDVDNLDADEIEILRALQKKLKKQQSRTPRLVISANKGNFSEFRNKTFIPNASRVAAAVVSKKGKPVSAGDSGEAVAPPRKHVSTVPEEEEDEVVEEEKEVVKPISKAVEKGNNSEEEETAPKVKAVAKSRAAPPSQKPTKESMFNAFGVDSDSEEEEEKD